MNELTQAIADAVQAAVQEGIAKALRPLLAGQRQALETIREVQAEVVEVRKLASPYPPGHVIEFSRLGEEEEVELVFDADSADDTIV